MSIEYTTEGIQINETTNQAEYLVNGVQINETQEAAVGAVPMIMYYYRMRRTD